jgi:uncharacterized protein (TIGR02246 family)
MKAQGFLVMLGMVLAGACGEIAAQEPPKPVPARTGEGKADRSADEAAIRDLVAAFVRAFDAGDPRAISALFTDDAEVIDEEGVPVQGREAITALFASTFETNPGATIEVVPESLRFLGPDVAKEEGRAKVMPARPKGGKAGADAGSRNHAPQPSRYSVIYVRQGGHWLQSSVREHRDQEPTPHERLEALAWLVGDWVDEGGESVVFTTARWSEDGNYLLRDFTVQIQGRPAMKVTQRIGWDPLSKQIKSWVFDSEGGHGEALWAREQNRWVVKASGVHPDGRTATATHVYTVVNKDMVRWKSIDRTVAGQIEPDIHEFVMVRKPPGPR